MLTEIFVKYLLVVTKRSSDDMSFSYPGVWLSGLTKKISPLQTWGTNHHLIMMYTGKVIPRCLKHANPGDTNSLQVGSEKHETSILQVRPRLILSMPCHMGK